MKLNPLQAASLARLQKYRAEPPSFGERLRVTFAATILLVPVALLLGFILVARLDIPGGVLLAIGLFIGAVSWDMLMQKRFIEWWPFTRDITDWEKVERLLAESRDSSEPVPKARFLIPPQKRRALFFVGALAFAILLGLAFGATRVAQFVHDPRRGNPSDGVVVLSASWCGYCMQLREQLAKNRIPYTDIDVEKTSAGRWAYTAVYGRGVPILVVGDKVIRGVRWPEISNALKTAGYGDFQSPNVTDDTGEQESIPGGI